MKTRSSRWVLGATCWVLGAGCWVLATAILLTHAAAQANTTALAAEVARVERAFAQTMAARDHAAFTSFLSDEAVFMPDGAALRGKPAVAAAWKRVYEGPTAPFSWEPDRVEVLDSGTLALSSGPVRGPVDRVISGNRVIG